MRRHGKGPQPRGCVSYPEALVRGLVIRASSLFNAATMSTSKNKNKSAQAFDTNASTTMSVCDGREGKMDRIQIAGAFTSRAVPPLHHWLAYFGQRYLDADDGAKLGDECPDEQGDPAWPGEFCRRLAGACAGSDGRFPCGPLRQTQDPGRNPNRADYFRDFTGIANFHRTRSDLAHHLFCASAGNCVLVRNAGDFRARAGAGKT